MLTLITTIIGWVSSKTGISTGWIKAGLVSLVLAAATAYHLDARHDAYERGMSEAVAECNITQLEEDLRLANQRETDLKNRNSELLAELDERDRENAERERFISSLQAELANYSDGELSDRSIAFMTILSQRSSVYHDNQE